MKLRSVVAPRPGPYRFGSRIVRIIVGAAAALAALGGGYALFGPFSDLSAEQLAAGPNAQSVGPNGQPIVLARTGRAWGAQAQQRAVLAASAPIATVARARLP